MSLHTEWIRYGDNKQYSGYVAYPKKAEGKLPSVIVLQEIWGVDAHIQDVTQRYAKAGYVAFSPDLYAENGERKPAFAEDRVEAVKSFLNSVSPKVWHDQEQLQAELGKLPEEQGKQIQETLGALFSNLDPAMYKEQLAESAGFLRKDYEKSKGEKVGAVGFCLGGALSAYLAGTDKELAAAAIFYGRPPAEDVIADIQCPVRGFYGELDPNISDQIPGVAEKMKAKGKSFDYKIYEGAQHAFFNDTRASYNVDASRDAFVKVLTFFNKQLAK